MGTILVFPLIAIAMLAVIIVVSRASGAGRKGTFRGKYGE